MTGNQNKWDPALSKTASSVTEGVTSEQVDLFDHKNLRSNIFYGKFFMEYLRFRHNENSNRVSTEVMAVDNAQR